VAERDELSGRFFEGAAAGAVMIGVRPRAGRFLTQFDWPDAVVDAPWDDPDVGALIERLDADPERLARIRRDGIVNSLLRHDWAYRLRTILADAGIAAPPALVAREARLRELAELARTAPLDA
jgi:glycosyl transferase family 1